MSEDFEQFYGIHTANQTANNGCQEAAGTCCGKPYESKDGAFWCRLAGHGLVARNLFINGRDPALVRYRIAGFVTDWLAVFVQSGLGPAWRGVEIHPVFDRLVSPEKNKDGENDKRHPGSEHLAAGVMGPGCFRDCGVRIFRKAPYLFGFPEEQKHHGAKQ